MVLAPDLTTRAGVAVRTLTPSDLPAIEAMWSRCGLATRLSRFHAPVPRIPAVYLEAVLADPEGTVVAIDQPGNIIGVASLVEMSKPDTGELGVLVEDQWQHRGVGRHLVACLIAGALRRGITTVTATVLIEDAVMAQKLRRVSGHYSITIDGPTCEVRVTLASPMCDCSVPDSS